MSALTYAERKNYGPKLRKLDGIFLMNAKSFSILFQKQGLNIILINIMSENDLTFRGNEDIINK